MAIIVRKNARRNRVQFTMSDALYGNYQECLKLAEQQKACIDFSKDFDRWFTQQLDQVKKELTKPSVSTVEKKKTVKVAAVDNGNDLI